MPAILTSNASVIAAENFITSIYENDTNLYLGVSKGYEDYPDVTNLGTSQPQEGSYDDYNRWTDEFNPPTPQNTIQQVGNFLKNLIGIKRILPANVMLVVPRNDWKPGKVYNPLNNLAINPKRAQDYYCVTSDEQGNNRVWICIDKVETTTGNVAGVSIVEPTLSYRDIAAQPVSNVNPSVTGYQYIYNNTVKCADGYVWKYLYNITPEMSNSGMMLDNWIPVPFNHHGIVENTAYQHNSGAQIGIGGTLTDEQIVYGDTNANRTLGCYRVLVTCTLADEGDSIPHDCIYRQVGLLVDPRASVATTGDPYNSAAYEIETNLAAVNANTTVNNAYNTEATPASYTTNTYSISNENLIGERLKNDSYPATAVDKRYGDALAMAANPVQVIYLENKKPIMREESQSEKLEMILVF